MTPKFLEETRKFVETEAAFWQAQATELSQKNVTNLEALAQEMRTRFQTATDAHSEVVASLWKHQQEAFERGFQLLTSAFQAPQA